MTAPSIRGYTSDPPWGENRIADTEDKAFKLGNTTPGGAGVNDFELYWFNRGYAKLYDPRLTIIPHPTMDQGSAADTTVVMRLGEYFSIPPPTHILPTDTPATPANTGDWDVVGKRGPMQDPFLSFENIFKCGIRWGPGINATPGWIRKAFQWDGSFNPDTWDLIYMPLSDLHTPDMTWYDPWVKVDNGWDVEHWPDVSMWPPPATSLTGYFLQMSNPFGTFGGLFLHDNAGKPWYDSVSNSIGYYATALVNIRNTSGPGYEFRIIIDDGTYKFDVIIKETEVTTSGVSGASPYAVSLAGDYVEVGVGVQGTEATVYIDDTARITGTLSVASTGKAIKFGILSQAVFGHTNLASIKYYLGGKTEPTG